MAAAQDADIILKLYELRRKTEMRKAREYIANDFWPESFEGLFVDFDDRGIVAQVFFVPQDQLVKGSDSMAPAQPTAALGSATTNRVDIFEL